MNSRNRSTKTKISGMALAAAAAVLFLSGAAENPKSEKEMTADTKQRCVGVNACQGKSECKTAAAEKGRNACRGHGVLFLTEERCRKLGGKIENI